MNKHFLLRVEHTEEMLLHLEHTFVVSQWQYLEQQMMVLSNALIKQPKDINIMSAMQKVENDIHLLKPVALEMNAKVFKLIEDKYGNGKKFKFFTTTPKTHVE